MDLKILSSKEFNVNLKCTIHASGKLGFTEATANVLKLSEDSGVKFAQDEEGGLYLINSQSKDADSFKVNKAGKYYYVNGKLLFDQLGYDYKNYNIIFDMVKVPELENNYYKLNERKKPRKK